MDLSDISKYIEKISCNVQISKNICNEILEKILSLDMFSKRYRIYEEGFEERIMPVKRFNVFYRVDKNESCVYIKRILYSGVDMSKITIG